MWELGLIIVIICALLITLIKCLVRWLRTPTYWHKTESGWYGTGHEKLTDKDREHIRKQREKNKK